MSCKEFINTYIKRLQQLLDDVDIEVIETIIDSFEEALKNDANIYIIGNGGSAATASHMANDLNIGLKRRNIRKFNVVSLADNTAVTTAIANDVGYDSIFYSQLENNLTDKDILLAISCSGNSPNIVKAVEYAKSMNTKVIGCTGFGGGKLKELSDIKFHVQTPDGEYGLVEDVHMILDHIIYSYFISLGE